MPSGSLTRMTALEACTLSNHSPLPHLTSPLVFTQPVSILPLFPPPLLGSGWDGLHTRASPFPKITSGQDFLFALIARQDLGCTPGDPRLQHPGEGWWGNGGGKYGRPGLPRNSDVLVPFWPSELFLKAKIWETSPSPWPYYFQEK